jgi:hypothetical protein
MSDLFDKVTSDQDPFTKLLGKVPGFKGYVERSSRRSADKILRDQIVTEFSVAHKRIGDLQQDFASSGELMYLDDLEKAAMKIQPLWIKYQLPHMAIQAFLMRLRSMKKSWQKYMNSMRH